MPANNILVIVVDGLRAASLGAYGNTTFSTPALDQFATESFLLDSCFAESTDLRSIYRALWRSLHPLRTAAMDATTPSLLRQLTTRGYHTTLVSDDPAIPAYDAAVDFDECVQLDGMATVRADDASQTSLARLFAAVCETVRPSIVEATQSNRARLIWAHARGMFGPWDAPLQLQESLLDREEGDPVPLDSIERPNFALAGARDPDAAYRASCAYAAEVMALDDCVDGLQQCLMELAREERWLTVLVGGRGFALGEHGRIGSDGQLFAELLHVPMLWNFPDGTGALARSNRLASHLDLAPTLVDWVGDGIPTSATPQDGMSLLPLVRDARVPWRHALVAANSSGQLALRTPDWCLRRAAPPLDSESTSPLAAKTHVADAAGELFVRPDDLWEANEVSGLCRDVVERLSAELDTASRRLREGEFLY